MFSGDPVRYEVMTRDLDLVKVYGKIISLGSVDFIDHNLPFHSIYRLLRSYHRELIYLAVNSCENGFVALL